MKDNDFIKFKKEVKLPADKYQELMNTLNKDATFLAKSNIIDYSLLLGEIDNTDEELQELKIWCEDEDPKNRP